MSQLPSSLAATTKNVGYVIARDPVVAVMHQESPTSSAPDDAGAAFDYVFQQGRVLAEALRASARPAVEHSIHSNARSAYPTGD